MCCTLKKWIWKNSVELFLQISMIYVFIRGHILVKKGIFLETLKSVLLTHGYHSAECDMDHSLICCRIKLQPKKIDQSKQEGKTHIDSQQDITSRVHAVVHVCPGKEDSPKT